MSILVLGAGELGIAMLKGLISHPSRPQNSSVTVLIRQVTKKSGSEAKNKQIDEIKALGVGIEFADIVFKTVPQLGDIFRKYDTIISCLGFVGPSETQRRICAAVLKVKVRRFIPWQFGVDYDVIGRGSPQPLFDEQLDVRDMLRSQSHTEWIVLSTGLFTSFLFVKDFGVVDFEQKKLRALGSWDDEITLTGPEDIARMTAEVLFDPRGIPGNGRNVVYIAGDTVSYARIAECVEKRFPEVKFTREEWNRELLKENLEKDEYNRWSQYRAIFGSGKGIAWPLEVTLNYERGIQLTDLETWLRNMETPDVLKAQKALKEE
ncbi:isoflavone reductase [Colletotrichum truncatum]|uniref:Isoflavone reductase n=1 Tax=Colletotrichum truncatum TaxID=5467 RepID=A0ACC3YGX2_COLTU|nr:isoflavone reductase [Colletotrichum truncatum]KAF6784123.1 isoflavone reductase [Colletotrichum truncatum]